MDALAMIVDEAAFVFPPPAPPAAVRTLHRDTDFTLTWCQACNGEGRVEVGDPEAGGYYDGCPWCEGTGGALEPCELIDMEDLDG